MEISQLYISYLSCTSISTDSRSLKRGSMFFALSGPNFNGNKFAEDAVEKGAKFVVIDDERYLKDSSQYILVSNTLKTLQKLATYHRHQLGCKVLALTGSNGKTTTKELVSRVLAKKYNIYSTQGNFNNHIGVPITLLSAEKGIDFLVVEMGANHQGEIKNLCEIAQPDFGFITNIGKAHLEGFGGLEGVRKGKSEIYRYLDSHEGLIFVNVDNDELKALVQPHKNIYEYNNSSLIIQESTNFLKFTYEGFEYESHLNGLYNLENIINAIQIGSYFEVSKDDVAKAIKSYKPNNNRSESVILGDITIFKDAYNANPTSLKASLEGFLLKVTEGDKYVIILGDMLELGPYSDKEHLEILKYLKNNNVENVVAIGPEFSKFSSDFPFSFYKNVNDYIESLQLDSIKGYQLFLKGSRGLKLERIVDTIQKHLESIN